MRLEDLREMSRRLREEYDLITCGYDPADDAERDPWIKCHAGDVLSREQALEEIARGGGMSEARRYNLTLTKVPRQERDKFRALRRPDTYFEVRPGEEGERVAYSVEMTEAEFRQARRDAENPESNLIAVQPTATVRPHALTVPNTESLVYVAARGALQGVWTGQGVDVGVVDSGLGEGLANGVFSGRIKAAKSWVDTINEPPSPPLTDAHGHGSAMAGIAVPALARIAVGKVLTDGGLGGVDKVARAVYWMVDEVGVDIINISLGYESLLVDGVEEPDVALEDAVAHAISRSVIICASRGNDGDSSKQYPAALPGVLAISNYDPRTDGKAPSSSFGDVFAASPGMAVNIYKPDGSIDYWEDGGTSSASAMATRVAASLLPNPDRGTKRDPDMVRRYLARTARKTGAGPIYEGNGVLQLAAAANAIRKERPECPPGTVPTTKVTEDIRFVQDASGAVVQVK